MNIIIKISKIMLVKQKYFLQVAIILLALVASAAAGFRTIARSHNINPSGEQSYRLVVPLIYKLFL